LREKVIRVIGAVHDEDRESPIGVVPFALEVVEGLDVFVDIQRLREVDIGLIEKVLNPQLMRGRITVDGLV
jgi:hypothetical protein